MVACKSKESSLALAVWLLLFALYLLTYRGGFHSVDEVSMYAVGESIVKFGEFNTDQLAWTQWATSLKEAQGFFGRDGHVYSKKGAGFSLVVALFYALALPLPGIGMLQAASLANAVITAATASFLYLVLRRLDYTDGVSMTVALVYGVCTVAWVYAGYLFSEPLAALLLVLAAWALLKNKQDGRPVWAFAGGLAAGMAVAARSNNLFLVPLFGLYLLWRDDAVRDLRGTLYSALVFVAGLIPPGAFIMFYNYARSGNPFQSGYFLSIFSLSSIPLGLYKLLFSPLRGLFVYSPVLLLGVPGFAWMWRRHRKEAALYLSAVAATVLLFAAWTSGEGLSWGSRFLVPVLPFAAIPLAEFVRRARGRPAGWVFASLAAISGLFQLSGVAVNPWPYLERLHVGFGTEFLEETSALYDFRYFQPLGQLESVRRLGVAASDVAWLQPWGFDFGAFLASVLLLAAGGAVLYCALRGSGRGWLLVASYALALLVVLFLLRGYYRIDAQFGPPDDPYTRALASIPAGQGARVITVAPYHYHVPMNRFRARVPILGLAAHEYPPPPEMARLLEEFASGEVWLVTAGMLPADQSNGVERWLAENAFKAGDLWYDDFRLLHYAPSPDVPLQDAGFGEGVPFDGGVLLDGAAFTGRARPGDLLLLETLWRTGADTGEAPSAPYVIFAQLLDSGGVVAAQSDGPPVGGYAPTDTWEPGQLIHDRRALPLPSDAPPGVYRLIAGMYDPADGRRLSVSGGRGDFVLLGEVEVLP